MLEQAVANKRGPLAADTVRAVFRELISGTRALQTPIRVAYLGPEFTFSHLAAIERFGQSAELVPVSTIAAVFEEVERRQAQFGVVPMENSTDGRVSDTLDCFSRSHVRICGELPLRIHHCLLGDRFARPDSQGLQQAAAAVAVPQLVGEALARAQHYSSWQHGRSGTIALKDASKRSGGERSGGDELRAAGARAEHRGQSGQHHAVCHDLDRVPRAERATTKRP